jgi:hypothetical protein
LLVIPQRSGGICCFAAAGIPFPKIGTIKAPKARLIPAWTEGPGLRSENHKGLKEVAEKAGLLKGTASAVPQVSRLQCGFSR